MIMCPHTKNKEILIIRIIYPRTTLTFGILHNVKRLSTNGSLYEKNKNKNVLIYKLATWPFQYLGIFCNLKYGRKVNNSAACKR